MEMKKVAFGSNGGNEWHIFVCNVKKLRPYGKYRDAVSSQRANCSKLVLIHVCTRVFAARNPSKYSAEYRK